MAGMQDAGQGAVLEARHIRAALGREYQGLIAMGDTVGPDSPAYDVMFASRALAAKAVRMLTGCTPEQAAGAVIDGRDGLGIDAIAVSAASRELWLIQAKWSDPGTARFTANAAHQLVNGLLTLDNLQFDRFNARFQTFADRVHDMLGGENTRVHLVAAVMGQDQVSREVDAVFLNAAEQFGGALDFRVLTSSDFQAAIQQDLTPAPVITATMTDGWFSRDLPHRSYTGSVSALEVARWFEEHGKALFDRNVRPRVGPSLGTGEHIDALLSTPEFFWYLNDSITVLCDSADPDFFARQAVGQPVRLRLSNPRIVSGAQTVATLYQALSVRPADVSEAQVLLRVIAVGDDERLAAQINSADVTTDSTLVRDSVAADPVQQHIRDDFKQSLGLEYVYRHSGLPPAPAAGCTVVEAATALACAHPDPVLAVRARSSADSLVTPAPSGTYTQLFGRQPTAQQIWRCVLVVRLVREKIRELSPSLTGWAAAIADSGTLLVAHLVFQRLDAGSVEDAETDWDAVLEALPEQAATVLTHLIAQTDALFGKTFVSSVFSNEHKCAQLVEAVLHALADDARTSPALSTYQQQPTHRPRRASSVRLLIEHGSIPDGTQLLYRPSSREEAAIGDWLNADPNRFLATWVNDPRHPLIWAADGRPYSPSGLVMHIWRSASWREAWAAVQGTRQWAVPGGATLDELAKQLRPASEDGSDGA